MNHLKEIKKKEEKKKNKGLWGTYPHTHFPHIPPHICSKVGDNCHFKPCFGLKNTCFVGYGYPQKSDTGKYLFYKGISGDFT